jgi:hypothetical protein
MYNKKTGEKNMSKNITQQIMKMDSKEINDLVDAIQLRRKQLHAEAGSNFKVGLAVQFGRPNGRKRTGTIEKLNITKAVVNVDGQKWRVPFGMMEAVQ